MKRHKNNSPTFQKHVSSTFFYFGGRMKATYNKIHEYIRRELSKNLAAQQKRMGDVSIKTILSSCHTSSTTIKRWLDTRFEWLNTAYNEI